MKRHHELHKTQHIGWLRAAVLGANDGIISTASLIVGVAASGAEAQIIFITAIAAIVAGAMSMAAGEYVSVSAQSDTEKADIALEEQEIVSDPIYEQAELRAIYIKRGLDADLADKVATQFMQKDPLSAHIRDELGISDVLAPRPLQAALSSATTFSAGASLPLLVVLLAPTEFLLISVILSVLMALMILGTLSAIVGGAPILKAVSRVMFWGSAAMGMTFLVGNLFNV